MFLVYAIMITFGVLSVWFVKFLIGVFKTCCELTVLIAKGLWYTGYYLVKAVCYLTYHILKGLVVLLGIAGNEIYKALR